MADVGTIIMEHEVDTSRLIGALFEADDVGAIVRCHYEAERALDFVLEKLTDGRSKRTKGWTFANRLEVCRMFGVRDMWTAPIQTINNQRNDFAHKGQLLIEDQQILDLYHQVRRIYPKFSDKFRLEISGRKLFNKEFGESSNREKYVMLASVVTSLFCSLPQMASVQKPNV
ncbi:MULTISPECIES: hypothetical protein [unclassified Mesorhizobium]|uniref:hypothetical protein n=1 Tax=unclassified Mesorhizobium TaxID=325217 RepID=UPI00112800C3|nr:MULTISPECIES: hypothetical protein [unclassified Mesorhizobium]TPI77692.1 hypothetical protein FJ423_18250 [Mesorhizobium sp. B2-8-9]TPJ30843.1 hypothetical protein FJ425_03695 [Mesorhizobium sp. B2-7-2]